jgi:membrane protein involved in colicin uptake
MTSPKYATQHHRAGEVRARHHDAEPLAARLRRRFGQRERAGIQRIARDARERRANALDAAAVRDHEAHRLGHLQQQQHAEQQRRHAAEQQHAAPAEMRNHPRREKPPNAAPSGNRRTSD